MSGEGLDRRQRTIWGLFDFAHGRGLEVGPLHNCCVPRSRADVSYLDVFHRAALIAHYGHDPNVPAEAIPEIDYVLADEHGTVRSIPEVIGEDARFDWVMASHVIEHVPDLIGWLAQIAEVVVDGGALVLAIPDRRYCFDLHRPGTSVGQMVQAHELGDVVPSVRAVYDFKRQAVTVRAPEAWAGDPIHYDRRIYTLDKVLQEVGRARAGEYVDSHVWLFTPGVFLEQVIELRTVGLADWRVETVQPTRADQLEFYAVLRRLPRDEAWPAELFADEPLPGNLPDWVADDARLRAETDRLRSRLADALRSRDEARERRAAVERKVTRLQAELRRGLGFRARATLRRQRWLRPLLTVRRRLLGAVR